MFQLARASELAQLLEERLTDEGLDVSLTAERLAGFHRVENTYLSTFQFLGGLGLMLGTLGLAVVLLRNVLERRRELAVLRAVGYTPGTWPRLLRARMSFFCSVERRLALFLLYLRLYPRLHREDGNSPQARWGGCSWQWFWQAWLRLSWPHVLPCEVRFLNLSGRNDVNPSTLTQNDPCLLRKLFEDLKPSISNGELRLSRQVTGSAILRRIASPIQIKETIHA